MQPINELRAQTPTMTEANNKDEKARLSGIEQLVTGLISGGLPSLKLAPVQWIIWVVIVPSMLQELWELLQLSIQENPNVREMQHMKRLRRQQFGHGVITGSAVSCLVQDLLTQPTIFTVLNCILYICLSICWALYWYFPSFAEFQTVLYNNFPMKHQPKTMAFFEPEEKASFLDISMGQAADFALPTRPEKRQRLATAA